MHHRPVCAHTHTKVRVRKTKKNWRKLKLILLANIILYCLVYNSNHTFKLYWKTSLCYQYVPQGPSIPGHLACPDHICHLDSISAKLLAQHSHLESCLLPFAFSMQNHFASSALSSWDQSSWLCRGKENAQSTEELERFRLTFSNIRTTQIKLILFICSNKYLQNATEVQS